MKTTLPPAITTIEEAKTFLTDLYNNGESYHPEDSAHDILWHIAAPTEDECNRLDKCMEDIYNLPGNDGRRVNLFFDPCEFLNMLDPIYVAMCAEYDIDQEELPNWTTITT